jgi:hypothetical protein
MNNNCDVSLKGVITNCTQPDNKKLSFEVAVMNVNMHNRRGAKWSFRLPPIVKLDVYCGNLTPAQIAHLTQKGTVALFYITLGDEILVEEAAYVAPHPAREIGEFIDDLNAGKFTESLSIR